MHNLFEPMDFMENLEDAATGDYAVLPRKTLRERQYDPSPLVLVPKYQGDFLEKLKNAPIQGKPLVAANPDSLWDFSWPSEWLKHQEHPFPRELVDDFYDINKPGEGAGYDTLKNYDDRSWDPWDAPEMSEDKVERMWTYKEAEKRVVAAYLSNENEHGPCSKTVVALYLLNGLPVELFLPENIKNAKLLSDLEKTRRTNSAGGTYFPSLAGITVRLLRAEPKIGRWVFATTSGKAEPYRTIFQFIPYKNIRETPKLHVRVSCSCPSFLFWGAQYHAIMGDYLYGKIRPKFAPPVKRDPKGRFLVCKHILACIPIVSKYKLSPISPEIRKQIEKAPRFEIEKEVPPEKLRIPKEFISVAKKSHIKDIVEKWDEFPRKRKSWIMSLEDPKDVTFFAHRFPETSTAYVAERLKQLAKIPKKKKEAMKYLEEIGEIKLPEIKIPASLKNFDTDQTVQSEITNIQNKKDPIKREIIKNQVDPDQLAYIAYKFHNDDQILSFVLEKLDEMAKDTSTQMEENRKKAKHWMREIL